MAGPANVSMGVKYTSPRPPPNTFESLNGPLQLDYCKQCLGDLIGEPSKRICGTCGLPENAEFVGQGERRGMVTNPKPASMPARDGEWHPPAPQAETPPKPERKKAASTKSL